MPKSLPKEPFTWSELTSALVLFALVAAELLVTAAICGGVK